MFRTLRSTILTTLLLTSALAVLAPGATAWTCRTAQNGMAVTVTTTGAGTYYEVHYSSAGGMVVELWKETNREPGLQSSTAYSCNGVADTKVASQCVGFCPIVL